MLNLPKFCILGGSSPFTIELINCLYSLDNTDAVGPYDLMLYGRNIENLEMLSNYAQNLLRNKGWTVHFTSNLNQALNGAVIVLNQIRYGGFEGRHDDEDFSIKHGVPPDETLGPSGLKSAIRMAPHLRLLAEKITQYCTDALVINLTNPLSIAVSLLSKYGVLNVIGICELPMTTACKIADILSVQADSLGWCYSGLNHRGFIYNLNVEGHEVLPCLIEKNTNESCSISNSEIERLKAVPLKYFRLINTIQTPIVRRAEALKELSSKIFDELSTDPYISPSCLKQRNLDWYKAGLIPFLKAINSEGGKMVVINKPDKYGITIETKALVSKRNIIIADPGSIPNEVTHWMKVFYTHENSVLTAAEYPSTKNIFQALNDDPIFSLITSEKRQSIKNYFTKQNSTSSFN